MSKDTPNKKTEIKLKATLDEKIRVAHQVLLAVLAYLMFVAVAVLITQPKARPPQVPTPPVERVIAQENYPKLGSAYLFGQIKEQDINVLSNWDLLVFDNSMDENLTYRDNWTAMTVINPDTIYLAYHDSPGAVCDPDHPWYDQGFSHIVRVNDWWLYDYLGEKVSGGVWNYNCIVNHTDELAGCDINNPTPETCAFAALADFVNTETLEDFELWDGIFYDTFGDNLWFIAKCRKSADRDTTPTKDNSYHSLNDCNVDCGTCSGSRCSNNPDKTCDENSDCGVGSCEGYAPLPNGQQFENFYFDNLWSQGMEKLASLTIQYSSPDVFIMGNGSNRYTLAQLNGRYLENFGQDNTANIHNLCTVQHYVLNNQRDPDLNIVDGMPRRWSAPYNDPVLYPNNQVFENPQDYQNLRWTMGATLLTDAYFSYDFGSWDHGETIWYDEYNIKPDGEVAAVTTTLTGNIDMDDQTIPAPTAGFTDSGIILIEGEQIWYYNKDDTHFYAVDNPETPEIEVGRGYPRYSDNKYDLRAPHAAGALVIQYATFESEPNYANYRGYLGKRKNDAYNLNDVNDIMNSYMDDDWYCEGKGEHLDTTIWRRDFENGTVVVNPKTITNQETLTVCTTVGCSIGKTNYLELSDGTYRLIDGLQDHTHNNGDPLTNEYQLKIESQDSYILIKTPETGSLDIELSGDPSVPQGGTMNIRVTVENNTSEIQTFDVWFDLTRVETRENIIDPFNDYQLGPGDEGVYEQSLGIPPRAQPDTYTLTAYVGPNFKDHDNYEDSADLVFEVTEIPCQFNCQEVTPLEFEITGSTTYLWREAERATITPPMKRAEDSEASDGYYILTPDGTGNGNGDPEDGQAQYTINIPENGNWVIWGRVEAPKGADNQTNDSFFVKMDDGTDLIWDLFQNAPGPYQDTWGWDEISSRGTGGIGNPEFDPYIFNLTQGIHTLYIKNREDGTKLDKLLITDDLDYVPEGLGE